MYLAIDTCTDTAGLALFDGERVISELVWVAGRNQTEELTPSLGAVMHHRGVESEDLKGLIVAVGPGSFNGIRVGMSLAKGLALTLDIPIVGVTTLEVHAFPFMWSGLPVWSMVEMGRGEVAAAQFESGHPQGPRVIEEHLTTPEELCDRTTEATVFCGTVSNATMDIIRTRMGDEAILPRGLMPLRSAADLAYLGFQKLEAGQAEDAAALAPLYLRRPPVGE